MEKENVLISACLLGDNCRYDGLNQKIDFIDKLTKYYNLIPFCPEVSGGLKTPRLPSEIKGDKVINRKGEDVTRYFNQGAFLASSICLSKNIKFAILKEESPSCGVYKIHDGNFKNNIIDGKGITTRKLLGQNIKVVNEIEARKLIEQKENEDI